MARCDDDEQAASIAPASAGAIDRVVRSEWGRLLAALARTFGDFQLAEDALQDSVESALRHWPANGLPRNPAGWLLQTARRKAIDRLRRQANFDAKQAEITHLFELDASDNASEMETGEQPAIPDHRLEMIFTCCHPALEEKSRVALTLRTLGGLSTAEIARAFLDKKEAVAARLTRAKKKIAAANIPYVVPDAAQLPQRLDSVLNVLYLIFNEGYLASAGDSPIRTELTGEAIRLARLLMQLMPQTAEAAGLLALMLLHEARKPARLDGKGRIVPLEEQDRSLWNACAIEEGTAVLKGALARGQVGAFQLQAAISACHCEAQSWEETDWAQILALYDLLVAVKPTPVVRLNRLLALARLHGGETALDALEELGQALSHYQPYHAARAHLLAECGRMAEALAAYDAAIGLSNAAAEKAFLRARKALLKGQ